MFHLVQPPPCPSLHTSPGETRREKSDCPSQRHGLSRRHGLRESPPRTATERGGIDGERREDGRVLQGYQGCLTHAD